MKNIKKKKKTREKISNGKKHIEFKRYFKTILILFIREKKNRSSKEMNNPNDIGKMMALSKYTQLSGPINFTLTY